jgi:hypothetical protein
MGFTDARLVCHLGMPSPDQSGGLADVSAALPEALAKRGINIRVMMPGYSKTLDRADHIGPRYRSMTCRARMAPVTPAKASTHSEELNILPTHTRRGDTS